MRDLLIAELLIHIARFELRPMHFSGALQIDCQLGKLLQRHCAAAAQRLAPLLALGQLLYLRTALDQLPLVRDPRLFERQDRLAEAIELLHELGLPSEHLQLQIGVLQLQQDLAAGHERTLLHQHLGNLSALHGIEISRPARGYDRRGRHILREHLLPDACNDHTGFAHGHGSGECVARIQRNANRQQQRHGGAEQQPAARARLACHLPVHRRELLVCRDELRTGREAWCSLQHITVLDMYYSKIISTLEDAASQVTLAATRRSIGRASAPGESREKASA